MPCASCRGNGPHRPCSPGQRCRLVVLLAAPAAHAEAVDARFISDVRSKDFPERRAACCGGQTTQRIFAEDQWGDYLIYRLYPRNKVFIDGRSDFYGDKFGESYLNSIDVRYGWDKPFDSYGIDTIVVKPDLALSSTLQVLTRLESGLRRHVSVVFRRNGPVPSSFVSNSEGNNRDRAITKPTTRDPRITQPELIKKQQGRGQHTMKNMFMRFVKEEQGQDLIEYTLLMAFIALASAAIFISAGNSVSKIWGAPAISCRHAASVPRARFRKLAGIRRQTGSRPARQCGVVRAQVGGITLQEGENMMQLLS